MKFNEHWGLQNKHAFLSASKYHWIRYTEEKLFDAFSKYQAAQKGTELHELAHRLITLGVKLPKTRLALNLYVNDAIGFGMTPERCLYYSDNCFGTADAISFKKDILRIHDLKTGKSSVSFDQLLVYAALFCLEYNVKPQNIYIELRIYQSEVIVMIPQVDDILTIMHKIILFDKKIEEFKKEV